MPANDYVFLTRWRVEGKAEEAFDILNDVPGYLRWWPEVYLAVENLALGDRDGIGKTYALLTRGKLPYRLRWNARITDKRRPSSFSIEASGDFVGLGVWSLVEHSQHLDIEFDWRLRAEKPLLSTFPSFLDLFFAGIIAGRWPVEKTAFGENLSAEDHCPAGGLSMPELFSGLFSDA